MLSVILTHNPACHRTNQKKHLELQFFAFALPYVNLFVQPPLLCHCQSTKAISIRVGSSNVYILVYSTCICPVYVLCLLTLVVCRVVIGLVSVPHYRTLYASLPNRPVPLSAGCLPHSWPICPPVR